MSLKELKEQVYNCNMQLYDKGLVIKTFGNVSGIDRSKGVLAIKPSGIPYSELKAEDIVLVDLDYKIVDSKLKPSSDTKTHIVLYKAFPNIGGIAHTHSIFATAWSQAKMPIPCFGTTHADHIQGEIPCTKDISKEQIEEDYEIETGNQIVKQLKGYSYEQVQMILVSSHGPFTWGKNSEEALDNSVMIEGIAKIALLTININPISKPITKALLNKHYIRKNGSKAYYGQNK